uniref:Ribosomal protein L6 n=1 Tax=Protohalopteris sp. TaxID=2843287 RepID=A0A8F0K262_9PHAE|nr:ribosomal protein L6 [Protohalopteris sp.]
MKYSIFRIPPKVYCYTKKDKTYVVGPLSFVILYLPSCALQKRSTVKFKSIFTADQRSAFLQALVGVSLSYSLKLRLKGIGYRVEKQDKKLFFKLGYSHPVIIFIPEVLEVESIKNNLSFRSAHLIVLKNFSLSLRRLRFPDSYKGSGVIYKDEIVVVKEGKKI